MGRVMLGTTERDHERLEEIRPKTQVTDVNTWNPITKSALGRLSDKDRPGRQG